MPTIGTCSECAGPVQVPEIWGGAIPPTPACASCGAKAAKPFGPVIPMAPRRRNQGLNTAPDLDTRRKFEMWKNDQARTIQNPPFNLTFEELRRIQ